MDKEKLLGWTPYIEVFIRKGNQLFSGGMSVRRCNGLIAELSSVLDETNIVFFEK